MLVPHQLKIYFGLGWPSSVLWIKRLAKKSTKTCVYVTAPRS